MAEEEETEMTIDELIERSHTAGSAEQRSAIERVNDFHAEISAAWREYRAGQMDCYWHRRDEHGMDRERNWDTYYAVPSEMITAGWELRGFWAEIADICVSLAATIAANAWRRRDFIQAEESSLPEFVVTLYYNVGVLYSWADKTWSSAAPGIAHSVIHFCVETATRHGVDLLALCKLRMAYNEATKERR